MPPSRPASGDFCQVSRSPTSFDSPWRAPPDLAREPVMRRGDCLLALLAVGVLGGSALVASAAEASSTESPSFYGLSKHERRLCEPSFYGLASPECDLHEHDVHLDHPRHHDHASDTLPPETCISMFGRRDAPFSGTWNGTKFGYFTIPRFFNALASMFRTRPRSTRRNCSSSASLRARATWCSLWCTTSHGCLADST